MRLADLDLTDLRFRTSADVFEPIRAACASNPDLATFETIGHSEEGRPIAGVTLGTGPRLATLVAGAHADEPVGPETLRTLVLEGLAARGWGAPDGGLEALFERFTLRIVPHVNPDAEARNGGWIRAFDPARPAVALAAYLRHRLREPPGRDVEFAYPDGRPENTAAAQFLFGEAPVSVHASLHGMGFSEGALLLIDADHLTAPGTESLRGGFRAAASEAGLGLHDHDRGGDKGFAYGGPGFTSTPRGEAMRDHFLAAGDAAMADCFRLSSMEMAAAAARSAGCVPPIAVVTELPLFVLDAPHDHTPGVPALLDRWTAMQPAVAAALAAGQPLGPLAAPLGLRALGLETAVRCHLQTLDLALAAV